jgi:tetratricopeptide (TPR) repeat protein
VTVARLLQRSGKERQGTEILSALAAELARQNKVAEEWEVLLELADLQLQGKDWSGVEATVAPLLTADDEATRLQAILLRGDALMQAKKYDEALAALQPGGDSPAVQGRRAEVLFRAGREKESREALAALAGRGDPSSAVAAAQAWQRMDRYQESIPILEKVVADNPGAVVAHFLLGAAYERTDQRPKAVTQLRRVLELQPDFHAALNYLGYTYAEEGENLDEALRLVTRAVALDPDNGSYVDSLGWTYYRLGRHEQARGYLERAARLEPTDATLHEHLGDVYVALGQNDRAREAYRRALELGDDNADEVRRKLQDLDRSRDRPRG